MIQIIAETEDEAAYLREEGWIPATERPECMTFRLPSLASGGQGDPAVPLDPFRRLPTEAPHRNRKTAARKALAAPDHR